jgi:hypothetical protein
MWALKLNVPAILLPVRGNQGIKIRHLIDPALVNKKIRLIDFLHDIPPSFLSR